MNKKVGILGGGFGLYGYLPAFANLNYEIFTLYKYENYLKKRLDLNKYINNINFLEENDLVNEVDYLSISRNPENQYKFLVKNKNSYKHLYLEKPIAHQSKAYYRCIENLENQKNSFSVFYSLSYMNWYENIIEEITQGINKKFHIVWKIRKPISYWKQNISKGGGLLKFYGIHFIKMLIDSNLVLKNVEMSEKKFVIYLETKNANSLKIIIMFSSTNSFKLYKNNEIEIDSYNPFLKKIIPGLPDPRIKLIEKYIESNSKSNLELEKNILTWLNLIEQEINSIK